LAREFSGKKYVSRLTWCDVNVKFYHGSKF
jgi:hypothetical protein